MNADERLAMLVKMAQEMDFNPEGTGELSGAEAVLEFLHDTDVTAALRALPQHAGGEVVAWMVRWSIPAEGYVIFRHNAVADYRELHPDAVSVPLYTAPQPQARDGDAQSRNNGEPSSTQFDAEGEPAMKKQGTP